MTHASNWMEQSLAEGSAEDVAGNWDRPPYRTVALAAGDWHVEQFQPLGGKVLIEREPGSERMRPDSLIILPELSRGQAAEKGRWAIGKIISMGPGMKVGMSKKWRGGDAYRWPMPDAAIGARVVYRTWAVRAELVRDGKKYDLVSDEVVDVVINEVGGTVADKLRPLFDRVLIKRIAAKETTAGGIIIPDNAKEKPVEGEILAVGPGRIQENGTVRALDCVVGDRILFGKFSGTEVQVDGVECVILREEDILGIVEKPTPPQLAAAGAAE